jgi:hypothetical protein
MHLIVLSFLLTLILPLLSHADLEPDFTEYKAEITLEAWLFSEAPLYKGQEKNNYSIAIEPEIYSEWAEGSNLVFRPFIRLDSEDSNRSHIDIREGIYSWYGEDWESSIGIGQVFWGVTESRNLVDVINQFDAVDDPTFRTKLGQPLISATLIRDTGYYEFFILPYFRERTSPGRKGRLRQDPEFSKGTTKFEGGSQWTPELALRWSNSIGNYDVSAHSFLGYARAPSIDVQIVGGQLKYEPNYQRVRQIGGTLQKASGATLYKLEWLAKDGQKDINFRRGGYFATVLGFEHTLYSSIGDNGDLGFLMEYNFDSRHTRSTDTMQDDIFVAARLTLNDTKNTEMLFASIADLDGDGQIYQLDFGRRINDSLTFGVQGAIYQNGRLGSNLYILRQDSWLEINFKQYF